MPILPRFVRNVLRAIPSTDRQLSLGLAASILVAALIGAAWELSVVGWTRSAVEQWLLLLFLLVLALTVVHRQVGR